MLGLLFFLYAFLCAFPCAVGANGGAYDWNVSSTSIEDGFSNIIKLHQNDEHCAWSLSLRCEVGPTLGVRVIGSSFTDVLSTPFITVPFLSTAQSVQFIISMNATSSNAGYLYRWTADLYDENSNLTQTWNETFLSSSTSPLSFNSANKKQHVVFTSENISLTSQGTPHKVKNTFQFYNPSIAPVTLNITCLAIRINDLSPSLAPSASPTSLPTRSPSTSPTFSPTSMPTRSPSASPTPLPTNRPTSSPTSLSTSSPSSSSTNSPSSSPTSSPTSSPSSSPTSSSTNNPSPLPTSSITNSPSPTSSPSSLPTLLDTRDSTTDEQEESNSAGLYAGSIIGALVLCIILVFGAVYPVVKLVQSRKHNNVQEKAQVVEPEPCLYLSDDAIVVSVHDDDDWFSKDWLSGMMPLGQYRHVSLKPLTEADMKFLDIKKMSRALYVHHPNVLSFQGLWKKGSAVYYVLEAVYSQQTFYQWINHPLTRSTLKLGDYIRLARSLCEGFEHLHEKDILLGEFSLHTVLVPASAFYGDSPDRVVQPRIAAGLSLVDNFNYIYALRPPESHEIETFTKFTDYWYMGLALWHVFDEGENPFSRVLSFSMVSDTIHKNFAIPLKPKYSTGPIHDFLNGCWQYSPEKRHIASTLKRFFVSLYEDLIRPGTFAFTEPDIELTTTVLKSRRHYENLSADTELTTTVLKSRRQYENISDDLYKENPPGHSENQ